MLTTGLLLYIVLWQIYEADEMSLNKQKDDEIYDLLWT
jgi:hypothetical protein